MNPKDTALNLESLQAHFAEAIASSQRQQAQGSWLDCVRPGGRIPSAAAALGLYESSYRACLTTALAETYEAVQRLVGGENFAALSCAYTARYPSTFYNLSDYGEFFADFIATSASGQTWPFLRDLARFEWVFKNLFHSDSRARVRPAQRPIESHSGCCFIPSAHIFHSPYAIYSFWAQRKSETLPFIVAQPEYLLLYKDRDEQSWVVPLLEWQYTVLAALFAGSSLEQALTPLTGCCPSEISDFFFTMASYGLIDAVKPL